MRPSMRSIILFGATAVTLSSCTPAPVRVDTGAAPAAGVTETPYFDFQVDKPATRLPGSRMPMYPDSLRASRFEGEVLAMFVVDTAGRVVPRSLRILRSSHPLFVVEVRAALPEMRFTPAELSGRSVPQGVQELFTFRPER